MSTRSRTGKQVMPQTLPAFIQRVDPIGLLPQLVSMMKRVSADPRLIRWAEWSQRHCRSHAELSRTIATNLCDYLAGRSSQHPLDRDEFRFELAKYIVHDERAHPLSFGVLDRMGVASIDRLGPRQRGAFLAGLNMLLSDPSSEAARDAEGKPT